MRARNIKPNFFKNELLAEVSPAARIFFIGLWLVADREGRLEYRPKRLQAEIFPYEAVDVQPLVEELQKFRDEFIQVYAVDGVTYIQITNFTKHQNTHKNETASRIPPAEKASAKTPEITGAAPDKYDATRDEYMNDESGMMNQESKPAAAANNLPPAKDTIWGEGVDMLKNAGVTETQARSFLAMALKKYDTDAVEEAVMATILAGPVDPKSYLLGVLKRNRSSQQKSGSGPDMDAVFRMGA